MRQNLSLKQKNTIRQEADIVEMQSICGKAHAIAADLVEKHGKNLKEIEREISKIEIPKEIMRAREDFNYREEILWAVKHYIFPSVSSVPAA